MITADLVNIPAGKLAGYIVVEASSCGEDLTYWLLDQKLMDEVDLASKTNHDYCEVMSVVIDNHNLYDTNSFSTIREVLEAMIAKNMVLVEDFNYISY